MKGLTLLALLASLGANAAQAGDLRDFCPNRPGKGSPACILDAGHWQVETDIVDGTRDHRAGVTTTPTLFVGGKAYPGVPDATLMATLTGRTSG